VSYVSVALAAAVILGEDMTASKLAGIALVGTGILLVVR